MTVTVNGRQVGAGSPAIIVLAPGSSGCDAAEELIRGLTGCVPSTWTDGQGTTVVVASSIPVSARPGRLGPELAVLQGHEGR